MDLWRGILLASAPALLFLWLFWRRDRWEREPKLLVLKLFGMGAVAAAPAYFLEGWLPGPPSGLYDGLVRVALVEEAMKLLPFLLCIYWRREFDEPMDGIVYAVAGALGFATVENVLYANAYGESVIVYRAFTSTLAHVAFSGLWGYAFGVRRRRAPAFAASVALHGAYDLLLSPGPPHLLALLALLPALLFLLWLASRAALLASPYRRANRQATGSTASDSRSIGSATQPTPPRCIDFQSRR
jgi:RsiW-degrading membrane proteinase PrsW (M82 family)